MPAVIFKDGMVYAHAHGCNTTLDFIERALEARHMLPDSSILLLTEGDHLDALLNTDVLLHMQVERGPQWRLVARCDREEAREILSDAWWSGKNAGQPRQQLDRTSADDGTGYVIAHIPLDWIAPNEAGDLYDGTVNAARAKAYAADAIDTPIHLMYGPRSFARGSRYAHLGDGGHRTSAARMRGDETIPAILQTSHLKRLLITRTVRIMLTPAATVERHASPGPGL